MASPVKLYQQEMHSNLGFFANWLPGDPIEVGDVGVLESGRFRRVVSLEDLGIGCDVSSTNRRRTYTIRRGKAPKSPRPLVQRLPRSRRRRSQSSSRAKVPSSSAPRNFSRYVLRIARRSLTKS
jgi:hypothetical protein